MRHLLDVDELSAPDVESLLVDAEHHRSSYEAARVGSELAGRSVGLLFAEPSTRTRVSFELAVRALGGHPVVIDPGRSSLVKGETLADTVRTLAALGTSVLVMRHRRSGAPWVAARYFVGSIVNAGDGCHAHPTQALLDLFTLRRAVGTLAGRKVAIVGDLLHSRVARSNAWTLTADGADLWACGPRPWLHGWEKLAGRLPAGRRLTLTDDLSKALAGADAVMALRIQKERMASLDLSLDEYVAGYQINADSMRAAASEAVFMHPGPVNEGIEVTGEVSRGPRSLVLEQVRNGVPIRMAVLAHLGRPAG
ncbi:MAG TPA: aspartate carbamoyltransferase catalytic subunit [Candidatus Limnocylindrales bacterium]|nr:aspartate carbamoyltransferase catalytic subunit [Candidatus Limnocylindrales bacterium]